MDPKNIELLANSSVPESVRAAIAQSLVNQELERKKLFWNTPLVAALAGLITLSATFLFGRINTEQTTTNTITLEQVRQELKDSEARLQQRMQVETAKTGAELQAQAREREFQYDIVKAELTNENKSNAERAAVLLFLVKAGILSTLNREELQKMAEDQLENPGKDIIPQLTNRGIVGNDDSRPLSALPDNHPARGMAASVGRLEAKMDSGGHFTCTAFLIAGNQIATAGHCVAFISEARFQVFPDGIDKPITYEVDLEQKEEFKLDGKVSYVFLKLRGTLDPRLRALTLSRNEVAENDLLGAVYFRDDNTLRVVWGTADCRLIKLAPGIFHHLCDTGFGSGGSPIFDLSTNSVVGIHFGRGESGGMAYRLKDAPRPSPG